MSLPRVQCSWCFRTVIGYGGAQRLGLSWQCINCALRLQPDRVAVGAEALEQVQLAAELEAVHLEETVSLSDRLAAAYLQ